MTFADMCRSTPPKTASFLAVFSYPARSFLASSYPCFLGFLFFGVTQIIHPFEISYRWKCLLRKSKPLLIRPTNVLPGYLLVFKRSKYWFTSSFIKLRIFSLVHWFVIPFLIRNLVCCETLLPLPPIMQQWKLIFDCLSADCFGSALGIAAASFFVLNRQKRYSG